MTLKDIEYFVHDLGEIRCDGCDKFLCYGFITWHDDSGMICTDCKKKKEIEQLPEVTKQKQEQLTKKEIERLCGESIEGHKWINVTSQTMCMGNKVYICTKCNAHKLEPMDIPIITLKEGEYKAIKNTFNL